MSAHSPYEQLKDDFGYLGLDAAAECFATLAEEAMAERLATGRLSRAGHRRTGQGDAQPAPGGALEIGRDAPGHPARAGGVVAPACQPNARAPERRCGRG